MGKFFKQYKFFIILLLLIKPAHLKAQTDIDGLMMEKNFFCIGPTAGYSSWTKYWEALLSSAKTTMGRRSEGDGRAWRSGLASHFDSVMRRAL